MPRVIAHPGHSLDDLRDARQRPQVRVEAVCPRPIAQRRLDLLQLFGVQAGGPAGPTRAAQGLRPPSLPLRKPTADALPAHVQLAGHRRQSLALPKQSGRSLPALFQRLKIAARPHPTPTTTVHAHARCIAQSGQSVTLLCEIQ
jgi:hypothetical protein